MQVGASKSLKSFCKKPLGQSHGCAIFYLHPTAPRTLRLHSFSKGPARLRLLRCPPSPSGGGALRLGKDLLAALRRSPGQPPPPPRLRASPPSLAASTRAAPTRRRLLPPPPLAVRGPPWLRRGLPLAASHRAAKTPRRLLNLAASPRAAPPLHRLLFGALPGLAS